METIRLLLEDNCLLESFAAVTIKDVLGLGTV
jgi:hypothetical protein